MQVLLFLIQNAGKKVTKEQIIEHVWKDRFVTEDILSVTVSKIRKALGDNARSPTFIKTLPSEGYILIANANKIESTEQLSSRNIKPFSVKLGAMFLFFMACLAMYLIFSDEGSHSDKININSIAVLPFDDLSSMQDNQHFTDGLPEAIINQLSQIKQLKVISRLSSFNYRGKYNATDIGQALQVDTLLDGSVQTIGDKIRINVRILSTKNGQQLWSKTFDSDTLNSFQLQDNISTTIQEIIQPGFTSHSKPAQKINAQAYEWYLMGQYHWRQRNPTSLSKAVTYFKRSLELAPDYADAHIGLGITYTFLHSYGNWSKAKVIEKGLPHIMKALALKPNSPTALAAKGMILSNKAFYESNFYETNIGELNSSLYQQAEQAFIRSLELDDNATTHRWYSGLLKRLGRGEEAIQHLNQAIELNPLSASLKRSISFSFEALGKQDTAQRMFQRASSLEPDYFSRVIDSASMNRHTPESVMAMATWQVANFELFTSCTSYNYCAQLTLSYLSIGANKAADDILDNMPPQQGQFLERINSITASERGNELTALLYIEKLALKYPSNLSVLFNFAVAQFRAGEYKLAKNSLSQLHPELSNKKSMVLSDVTADNYLALVLYAVTLSNLHEKETADSLLHIVQTFLKLNKVFDKVKVEFTLAEINAQLGNTAQALLHLTTALEMGWLESYNREWWSLQNNHLLAPLHKAPEFKLLLMQHQGKLIELREKVTLRLSTIPSSIE
jgi:TolB-like protein/Flp pilus assembly protein TadD